MKIEYDERKASANIRKHGVSFDEAKTALYDPLALVIEDCHSIEEGRFVLLGKSQRERLLTVVYAYRDEDIIRLISARKATSEEKRSYESGI